MNHQLKQLNPQGNCTGPFTSHAMNGKRNHVTAFGCCAVMIQTKVCCVRRKKAEPLSYPPRLDLFDV